MLSTEGIFQKETILFCYLAEISPVERSQQNILYFPEGLVNRYVIYYHILSVKIKIKKDTAVNKPSKILTKRLTHLTFTSCR